MALIADILLVAGALGASFYCWVLSRRLNKFNDLEKGVGGAVAVLSIQVDDMTKSLINAQAAVGSSTTSLETLTIKASDAAKRLELLMASMHDLPTPNSMQTVTDPAEQKPDVAQELSPAPAAEVQFVRHREPTMEAAE